MSITTTETRTSISVLADYEIHHSGAAEDVPGPSATLLTPSFVEPASWPTHHRRIPPYRPVNYNLDFDERPIGSSPGESVFIFVMMHGVWLNASVAKLWRKTGGKLNEGMFQYKVGGEW
ncbi:hypothetical protein N7448_003344 [Penicillium atrosanguineum]|uniref:Uncharacterized protein n=1 Tax=Penicillium atrosanguineum TaxID=1132637 RepID=A0A9W9PVQ2_9EURO|nr:uncharacterized protein N7443_002313 [Penicillium atrosanguineum]KAJ5122212.1 hypothetical protein N7526_009149 [Penicillium atrosanguineum]KAJ5139936.1 hypothetical protein N7448_003344 [Penicillium atrosanguineum]KAJ5309852.1 hypothetical protein N7443_002313 [Penicillium atrosanguineum]KAJ5315371.1 hypothetical protein N7476_005678 [Penicillium atrosanguineum]